MTPPTLFLDWPIHDAAFADEPVPLLGWAYAEAGIEAIEILVNNRPVAPPLLGMERPDVAAALSESDAIDCGWSMLIDESDLVDGENVLSVIATAPGSAPSLLERRFHWRRLRAEEIPYTPIAFSRRRQQTEAGVRGTGSLEHHVRYRFASALAHGQRVLDVGCGQGYGARMLLSAGASAVEGVDTNAIAIAKARSRPADQIHFAVADARSLPYPERSFGVITCFGILEHVADREQIVRELHRVVAPAGMTLVSVPDGGAVMPEEASRLMRRHFQNVTLLRQQSYTAAMLADQRLIESADDQALSSIDFLKLHTEQPANDGSVVLVASDDPLPDFCPFLALGEPSDGFANALVTFWRQRAIRAETEAEELRDQLKRGAPNRDSKSAPPSLE